MRVQDIHAAVERLLGMRVSKDSVNSCLSTGSRGKDARFERVGRGCYLFKTVANQRDPG